MIYKRENRKRFEASKQRKFFYHKTISHDNAGTYLGRESHLRYVKSSSGRLLQRNGRVALADRRRRRQAEYAGGGCGPRGWLIPPPIGRRRFVVHFQRQLISTRPVSEKQFIITYCYFVVIIILLMKKYHYGLRFLKAYCT